MCSERVYGQHKTFENIFLMLGYTYLSPWLCLRTFSQDEEKITITTR